MPPPFLARDLAGLNRRTVAGFATVTQLCKLFGISRAAYYAARKPPTPRPRPRVTRRASAVSQQLLTDSVRQVLAAQPAWGVRKVWATLRRRGLTVSRHRVWELMRGRAGPIPHGQPPRLLAPRRVIAAHPDQRWATDFTTAWTRRGGLVTVSLVVDCGCRSLLALDVTPDRRATAILAPVERALRHAFGSPDRAPPGLELRTDHGSQYTGRECLALAARWGLTQTRAPVAQPTGNAVVERLIRTMKEEVIWLRDWEDAEELRRALTAWRDQYNTARPHQALGFRTPAEVRAMGIPPQG